MPNTRLHTWTSILQPAWQLVKLDHRELSFIFLYILALGLISAAVPFASQIVVNQTAFTGTALPVVILALVVLGVLIIGVFIRLFQLRVVEILKNRIFVRSGLQSAQALLRSLQTNRQSDDREVANRFFEVINFQNSFAVLISDAISVLALSFFGVLLLAIYHPFLLLFSMLNIAGCLFVIFPLARRGVRTNFQKSTEKYRVAYWLSEVAENRTLLKQGSEDHIVWRMTDRAIARYVIAHLRYLNLLLTQSGGLFIIQAIGSSAFLGLGGWLVVNGQLNLGQLVAAEIIILSVLGSLSKFDKFLDASYDAIVSAQKLNQLTSMNPNEAPEPSITSHTVPPLMSLTLTSTSSIECSLRLGDIVRLQGGLKGQRSDFLKSLSRQFEGSNLDLTLESQNGFKQKLMDSLKQNFILYLAEPVVFHLSLDDNLKILAHSDNLNSEKYESLLAYAARNLNISDHSLQLYPQRWSVSRAAYLSVLRALFTPHPVVVIDYFFDAIELQEQKEFFKLFKEQFPERILIVNTSDPQLESFWTQKITLTGSAL